jgi:hypothetical protein
LLVALHLDDGEPTPLTRDGLPQARDSGVFALPTGAEMIVTRSPPRDRERPRRSPPSISRAVAAATFRACLAYTPDPLPSATRSARYLPSARGVDDPRIIMIWR